MTWERGRAEVEKLLAAGELQTVTPSVALGERMLDEATRHLASARTIIESDPTGAYSLAYDCARKASAALLAPQGLRATTRGGHIAIQDAVRHQFNGAGGLPAFRAFPRLRRTRNTAEYPDLDTPDTDPADAGDGIAAAESILTAAQQVFATGRLDVFERSE